MNDDNIFFSNEVISAADLTMKNLQIKLTETLSENIEKRMEQGFLEYETEHGIEINYNRFYFLLLDEQELAFGVLNAFTVYAEIYIDDLWVDKSIRGQGYGRVLLTALENHFRGKGYNNINLVTNAFQAPDFYKNVVMKLSLYGKIK
ncbi:GNAT family N-acetyltransferase [Legionella tunisiensis]|uniref:GNAT family N-acetyltransferase n=1 Tax=Legionella tunisiensis TaxID=1034944 RepID=UPI0012EA86BF|nr:GNAT family N-acetyltransferase [Legionella tunisiensis]